MRVAFCLFCLGLALAGPSPDALAAAKTKKKPAAKPTKAIAIIETNQGVIKLELFEKEMPITTRNFIELAKRKFYDGLKFHRVVENFVIQGGDPQGTGAGGSDKTIKLEINKKVKWSTEPGLVGMARTRDPDSASSQFFISTGDTTMLNPGGVDPNGYALFGKVIYGQDVANKIKMGDVMKRVYITRVPVK